MKKVFSLALGGGGARGLAHIGVIRRLEEFDMKPQAIAGTSMGAIIGALLSIGKTSEEMEAIIAWINFLKLIDPDMSQWLVQWKKIEKFLDKIFEGKSFSDTKIPLQVVATDINTWERIIFSSWKLSDAVRASIWLPGVFVPKPIAENVLVDGWLTNNLPIEALPPWKVIAVSALRDLTRKLQKSRKILGIDFKKSIFWNSYNLLQKTIDIMLSQNESRSLLSREDITYIRPTFDKLDYYEFNKYKDFIKAGYTAAKDIGEWILQ
jgi:NTE family protein